MCVLCQSNPFVDWHSFEDGPGEPQDAGTAAGGTSNGVSTNFNQGLVDQLNGGGAWVNSSYVTPSTISFGFPTDNSFATGRGEATGWSTATAEQKTAVREIMGLWNDLVAPSFVEATGSAGNSADIKISNTTTSISYAHAYYPGMVGNEGSVIVQMQGSVWLNPGYSSGTNNLVTPTSGIYGYTAIMHEVGHSLGLQHGGNYNGGSPAYGNTSTGWLFVEDSRQYTIMSYFSASSTGANHGGYYPQTPMVYDIMAIQDKYGADYTTRAGNTVYGFNSTADRTVYNFAVNTTPVLTIWDGGGIDTIDVSGWSTSSTIFLAAGSYSSVNGLTYNLAIAYDCDIENATTGTGNDTITGNDLSNILAGGGGNDTIHGAAGSDMIDGGTGDDTLNGNDGLDIIYGGDGIDTIDGGTGDDALYGNAGNDTLNGGAGNDVLDGGVGVDITKGGDGNDTIVYDANDNLAQLDGGAGFDTLVQYGAYTAIDLASRNLEQLKVIFTDTGSQAWSEKADYYNQAGQKFQHDIAYDNGTRSVTDFDVGNAYSWAERTRTYDANGNLTSDVYVPDGGSPPPNTAPTNITLGTSTVAENASNGTVIGALSSTDPDAGETFTYTLLDNAGGRFALSGANVVVANGSLLNFEAATSHNVQVRVTDSAGNTFTKTIAVGVSNVNEAPTNVTLGTSTVTENAANGTVVGALTTTDADAGETFTYTLLDNAGGRFALSGANVVVANGSLLNFEAGTSHNVQVRVTDAAGNTFTKTIAVGVSNVNEAPTNVALANATIAENSANGAVVGALSATDPDTAESFTYTLLDNAGGRFAINGSNIVVANGSLLNFEAATSHNVQVRVTDSAGNTFTKTIAVGVSNVNEAPTNVTVSNTTVTENAANGTIVGALSATDPDTGETFTYTLTDTAGGRFAVNGSNIVVANSGLLNFEAATSHNVQVKVTDSGGNSYFKTVTIGVANMNEAPTDIAISTAAVAEGSATGTVVGALTSADPDAGESFTYTLLDNAGGRFALNGSNLVVANGSLIDYETATSHNVQVRVTDSGGNTFTKTITIGVDNISEGSGNSAPTDIQITKTTITENVGNGIAVGILSAIDADAGETFTYAMVNDAGGRFAIDGNKLAVANGSLLNFEAKATHDVQVKVTDSAGNAFTKTITVQLQNVNETPFNMSLSKTTITENVANGTAIGVLSAIDPDAGDTRTYTLLDNAGGRFAIDGNKLVVANGSLLNFEAKATHDVQVRVTDAGGKSSVKTFTVQLQNVNETPYNLSISKTTITENVANGTAVGVLSAIDPDAGDTLTYTLLDNAGGRFAINGNKLVVANGSLLNFEAQNTYGIQVRVTDAGGKSTTKTFTVELQNVNETPFNITLSKTSIAENSLEGTVIGNFSAIEPDAGDTNTFTLLNDAGGRFSIIDNKLVVANGSLIDFEVATSHTIQVQVTDAGGKFSTKTITIGVTDVSEVVGPTFSMPAPQTTDGTDGDALHSGGVATDTIYDDVRLAAIDADVLIGGCASDNFSFGSLADWEHAVSAFVSRSDKFDVSKLLGEADHGQMNFDQLVSGGYVTIETGIFETGLNSNDPTVADTRIYFDTDGSGPEARLLVVTLEDFTIKSGDILI